MGPAGASVVVVVDDVVVELVVIDDVAGGWGTVGSLAEEHEAVSRTVAAASRKNRSL
ncbi:MAG: hypothetical protein O3B42_08360 [Actinomycetota bacterium]|nr:hypothetical protein [Actinomycetota bacterium]